MTRLEDLSRPALLAFAFASALVAGSCASAPRLASRSEVEGVVNGLVAAVNAADVEGFMAFFAPEASVFLPSAANPSRLTGHAQIRAGIVPALESKPNKPMAIRDLMITVEGTMAVASFEIGNPIVHSRRTLVLKHLRGEWKIIHLHSSNLRAEGN